MLRKLTEQNALVTFYNELSLTPEGPGSLRLMEALRRDTVAEGESPEPAVSPEF